MTKRKKLRLAKWEKTTKAIGVSLTIIQLSSMSMPMAMNYASAADTFMEQSQSENNQQPHTVSNDVYARVASDTVAPEATFEYSALSGYLRLNFDEPVQKGYGYLKIYDQATDEVAASILFSGNAMISGYHIDTTGLSEHSAWFHVTGLQNDHSYKVVVWSGMFHDLSGNTYAGTGDSGWSFNVTDVSTPALKSVHLYDPGAGEKASLNMFFNKPMHFGREGSIRIYRSADHAIQQTMTIHDGAMSGASYNWFSGNQTLQVEPNQALADNTDYYVTATSGTFMDWGDRELTNFTEPNTWSFRTADHTAPQATFEYSALSGYLRLNFDEPVQKGYGYLKIYDQATNEVVASISLWENEFISGYHIKFKNLYENSALFHVEGLQAGESYRVMISSGGLFQDLNGNSYKGTGEAGWNFRITNVTKPETKSDKKTTTSGGGGVTGAPSTSPVVNSTPQSGSDTSTPKSSDPSASNTGTDKIKTPATTTSMLVEPQLASSGTVSLPAPIAPTANTFVHYYDAKWDKWIAVPTTSDGTTLKADVPAGSWTSVINSEQAVKPADVVKSWAVAPVMKLMSLGIVQGDTQGNYNPKQAINRYEMAVILAKTLRLDVNAPSQGSPASSANAPDWAQPYVQAVVSQGIMTGNSDSFNGNGQVTREQLATLIGRMLPDSTTTGTPATNATFKDASKMSTWAVQGIAKVQALGLMKGYDDQNFRPKQAVTREEMAAVIAKVVDML